MHRTVVSHRSPKPSFGTIKTTFLLLAAMAIISMVVTYVYLTSKPLPSAFGIVIYSDPITVLFPRKANGEGRVIIFPRDVVTPAVGGLGQYEVDALWRLAQQEKNPDIFTRSLAETLGVPIIGSIGRKSSQPLPEELSLQEAMRLLLQRELHTNLSARDVLSLVAADIGNGEKDSSISLGTAMISEPQQTPDERTIRVADIGKIDYLLSTRMYDETVRAEGLRIAVKNTTTIPLLGSRAGRILSNAGVNVVSISNDTNTRETCEIHAEQELLDGPTAQLTLHTFACVKVPDRQLTEPVDMVVYIGESYAAKIVGALK